MPNLARVTDQESLKSQSEPHWQSLGKGVYLGLRKADATSKPIWWARHRDAATGKRSKRSLGDFAHLSPSERFSAAKKAAEAWFEHLGRGGSGETLTVAEACDRYVEHLASKSGEAAAENARARFARHIAPYKIALVHLQKLTPTHVRDWRKTIERMPAVQARRGANCRNRTPLPDPKPRSSATVNRDLVPVRAALNLAFEQGLVTSNFAWRSALKPATGAEGRRDVYLSPDQRRALLAHIACQHLRAFVHCLCVLPLRPGSLAALTAGDFDTRAGMLTVRHDKAGAGRKILLPDSVAAQMREQVKGKLPRAPLFTRPDGSAWTKDYWKKPVKSAAIAAGLSDETVTYTLRHSAITDLVSGGLDLMSVCQIAGTSVRMIEKHYAQFQATRARDALESLAI